MKYVVRVSPHQHRTYWGISKATKPFRGSMILAWIEDTYEIWRFDCDVVKALTSIRRLYRDDYGFEPHRLQVFHQKE